MVESFLKDSKLDLAHAQATSDVTTLTGTVFDMSGFDGCVAWVRVATVNAANILSLYEGDASDGSDGAAISGATSTAGHDSDVAKVECLRPLHRYMHARLARGTATVAGDMYFLRTGPKVKPITNADATVVTGP